MQFWSDIIVRDEPELVDALPRDVIALEWGYDDDLSIRRKLCTHRQVGTQFLCLPRYKQLEYVFADKPITLCTT